MVNKFNQVKDMNQLEGILCCLHCLDFKDNWLTTNMSNRLIMIFYQHHGIANYVIEHTVLM